MPKVWFASRSQEAALFVFHLHVSWHKVSWDNGITGMGSMGLENTSKYDQEKECTGHAMIVQRQTNQSCSQQHCEALACSRYTKETCLVSTRHKVRKFKSLNKPERNIAGHNVQCEKTAADERSMLDAAAWAVKPAYMLSNRYQTENYQGTLPGNRELDAHHLRDPMGTRVSFPCQELGAVGIQAQVNHWD